MSFSMTRRGLLASGLLAPLATPLIARAQGTAWPNKQLRIICAFPAGGITDAFARAYGEFLSQKSGQTVVVENRPGAGGGIAAQALKTAPDDGHTLMITISTTLFGNRVMFKSLAYDPDKDFSLLALLPTGSLPLVAAKATGASNIAQFVEYARKNRVSFGSYAAGSMAHIVCNALNQQFNLDMTVVNYRGEAPMWQDVLTGNSQIALGSFTAAKAVLDSNTGTAIAIPSTRRMKALPDTPTFAEQGLDNPVFRLLSWVGFLGQSSMPQPLVETVSALMLEAAQTERIRKLNETFGIEDPVLGHADFKKIYDSQGPIWIENVRKLGLTPA
ncbi:MAG: tripartite tricarboxylate transporter substrate binding protein [Phreatobacter sp.]|uniref:Bug family tripartite tricarboxylate transporter substrate binding protein n=1 Tax=Phreatobacter sp. TaxID=1966341 RepID=UPI002735C44E|nr:tripartite tricarboxylate transporter substrate binding protein [Phreatobacter sp.]MDP2801384.1 tripartite tricarboxylate transporter substrate binding protein [Phreatobacter sp.]